MNILSMVVTDLQSDDFICEVPSRGRGLGVDELTGGIEAPSTVSRCNHAAVRRWVTVNVHSAGRHIGREWYFGRGFVQLDFVSLDVGNCQF